MEQPYIALPLVIPGDIRVRRLNGVKVKYRMDLGRDWPELVQLVVFSTKEELSLFPKDCPVSFPSTIFIVMGTHALLDIRRFSRYLPKAAVVHFF